MLYLAENIKALRKAKDLTQEEVADILGVTAQSVSKWERGETYPDIQLLPALANFYQIDFWQTRCHFSTLSARKMDCRG
ncbi:hypothetical protein AGMMS49992_18420 [Clostridia bacterium]|nr:hypothetical protein AGMMS49992_18420 [Clostridia bacterium]